MRPRDIVRHRLHPSVRHVAKSGDTHTVRGKRSRRDRLKSWSITIRNIKAVRKVEAMRPRGKVRHRLHHSVRRHIANDAGCGNEPRPPEVLF
jgi:hypothetical protein